MYVQCVDDTGNVAQDREQDVDEEVCATTTLEEDSERWEKDGEDDFDDITGCSVSFSVPVAIARARLLVPGDSHEEKWLR